MDASALLMLVPACLLLSLPHELAHLLTARALGVPVAEFGIGLPPRAVHRRWRGVAWSINWVPLGAFVRFAPAPDGSGARAVDGRSAGTRALIAAAGPVANGLVAALLLALAFLVAGVSPGEAPGRAVVELWAGVGRVFSSPEPTVSFSAIFRLTAPPVGAPPLARTLAVLASLSLAFGIGNLTPLPPLDGAKLVCALIDAVCRRAVADRVWARLARAGVAILAAASALVLAADVARVLL